jgi:hypothetical protein
VTQREQSLGHKTTLKLAHNLGLRAWGAGESRGANPYLKKRQPREWAAWDEGWVSGRDASAGAER